MREGFHKRFQTRKKIDFGVTFVKECFSYIMLLAEKFLQSDWLRLAVFQPNLKNLHVEITVAVTTGGIK